MLLNGRTAIVYGAGGPIGSAVARSYAEHGASVHLVGRTRSTLDRVALAIRDSGGRAEVAVLDALDLDAMRAHASRVAAADRIDIAFDALSNDDVQGPPILGMPLQDVLRPVTKSVTGLYSIAAAVAPHMRAGGSGVILAMAGGREAIPSLGGAHIAWSALAGTCRQLAADLGPDGIRVSWILSPGSPDDETVVDPQSTGGLIGRRPSLTDVARTATFLASDWASTITASETNITGGLVVD